MNERVETGGSVNAASVEPVQWPRRRWFYAIGMVFLVQVGLIFFVAERPRQAQSPPPFGSVINLAMDPQTEAQLAQLPELSDPTIFALPNMHGFSGGAWLKFTPDEHHFMDWTQPECWLALVPTSLGK